MLGFKRNFVRVLVLTKQTDLFIAISPNFSHEPRSTFYDLSFVPYDQEKENEKENEKGRNKAAMYLGFSAAPSF